MEPMCNGGSPTPSLLYDVEPPFEIQLEPVDSVTITTIVDNVSNIFMPDQGPAKRFGPADIGAVHTPTTILETGEVPNVPVAEHGYSALVDVTKGDQRHRILF